MASTQSLSCGGFDEAERHGVGSGAGTAQFARQGFHQPDDAGASRGDDGEPRFADTRGIADHADDAAVLAGLEMRRRGMAAVDRAIEAGVDLAVPVVGRCLNEALALGETGIVDRDMFSPPKSVTTVADHRLHGGEIGDVGFVGFGLAALRRDLFDKRVRFFRRATVVYRNAAPSAARLSAISLPTPLVAPVTKAILPVRFKIHGCSSGLSRLSL